MQPRLWRTWMPLAKDKIGSDTYFGFATDRELKFSVENVKTASNNKARADIHPKLGTAPKNIYPNRAAQTIDE